MTKMENITLLMELNQRIFYSFVPAIVLLSLIFLVGTVGNTLVLYNYYRSFKRTTTWYFIISLALYDIFICFTVMPLEIVNIKVYFVFSNQHLCRFYRLVENAAILGSMWILFGIAAHTYVKICHPFYYMKPRHVIIVCCSSLVLTLPMHVPLAFTLFGITRKNTTIPGLRSYNCDLADETKGSILHHLYNGFLCFLFVAVFLGFAVFYGLVLRKVRKQAHLFVCGAYRLSRRRVTRASHHAPIGLGVPTPSENKTSEEQISPPMSMPPSIDCSKSPDTKSVMSNSVDKVMPPWLEPLELPLFISSSSADPRDSTKRKTSTQKRSSSASPLKPSTIPEQLTIKEELTARGKKRSVSKKKLSAIELPQQSSTLANCVDAAPDSSAPQLPADTAPKSFDVENIPPSLQLARRTSGNKRSSEAEVAVPTSKADYCVDSFQRKEEPSNIPTGDPPVHLLKRKSHLFQNTSGHGINNLSVPVGHLLTRVHGSTSAAMDLPISLTVSPVNLDSDIMEEDAMIRQFYANAGDVNYALDRPPLDLRSILFDLQNVDENSLTQQSCTDDKLDVESRESKEAVENETDVKTETAGSPQVRSTRSKLRNIVSNLVAGYFWRRITVVDVEAGSQPTATATSVSPPGQAKGVSARRRQTGCCAKLKKTLSFMDHTSLSMFIMCATFVLCYAPSMILLSINVVESPNQTLVVIYDFIFKLSFVQNAIHPVIYLVFNRKFKRIVWMQCSEVLKLCSR